MATLKYKTPEGEWKKVSIGGGGSTEEVYVGSDEPTDENVKVWIDPTGTPSGGNGGNSGGISMYYFPDSLYGTNNYIFSDDEKVAFVEAIANVENTVFRIKSSNSGGQHIQFVVMNISETGSMFMATLGTETIVVEIGNLPSGGITGGFIVS